MPTKRYPLEPNGPERLDLTWGMARWSNCTVSLDGVPILVLPLMEALRHGGQVTLASGEVVTVKKVSGLVSSFELLVGKQGSMPTPPAASGIAIEDALPIFMGIMLVIFVLFLLLAMMH